MGVTPIPSTRKHKGVVGQKPIPYMGPYTCIETRTDKGHHFPLMVIPRTTIQ